MSSFDVKNLIIDVMNILYYSIVGFFCVGNIIINKFVNQGQKVWCLKGHLWRMCRSRTFMYHFVLILKSGIYPDLKNNLNRFCFLGIIYFVSFSFLSYFSVCQARNIRKLEAVVQYYWELDFRFYDYTRLMDNYYSINR